jgi:hypothetical protein
VSTGSVYRGRLSTIAHTFGTVSIDHNWRYAVETTSAFSHALLPSTLTFKLSHLLTPIQRDRRAAVSSWYQHSVLVDGKALGINSCTYHVEHNLVPQSPPRIVSGTIRPVREP